MSCSVDDRGAKVHQREHTHKKKMKMFISSFACLTLTFLLNSIFIFLVCEQFL